MYSIDGYGSAKNVRKVSYVYKPRNIRKWRHKCKQNQRSVPRHFIPLQLCTQKPNAYTRP